MSNYDEESLIRFPPFLVVVALLHVPLFYACERWIFPRTRRRLKYEVKSK